MKEDLRKELLIKRKSLSHLDVLKKSSRIGKRLFKMNEYKESQEILFYISYDNEVYTHDMIKECLSVGKSIIVPVSNKEKRLLKLSKLKNWNDLELGSYGILEPKKDKINETSIESIDIIIVPGVGFDEFGCRIGHGVGYYDNLLKESINASHIGLAFEIQIVEKVPVESHDLPVDKIITEKRIIYC